MTHINRIGHVVLHVRDPIASADWYRDVLGMEMVVDSREFDGVFLSFGTSDHDIALFKAPDGAGQGGRDLNHVALEFGGSLDEYKAVHADLVAKNVEITGVVDHGISYGIYFLDPDGHTLEIFRQRMPNDGTSKQMMMAEIGAIADPVDLAGVTD
jgi:catechol-2,3-dioxygenase